LLRKHQKSHASSVCNVCGQVLSDKFALTKHQIEVSLFFIIVLVGLPGFTRDLYCQVCLYVSLYLCISVSPLYLSKT
jgi:hypothetical protein